MSAGATNPLHNVAGFFVVIKTLSRASVLVDAHRFFFAWLLYEVATEEGS